MNQTEQHDNAKALAAWEEWRERCFVFLVSSDGDYGDLRTTLRKLIHRSFVSSFFRGFFFLLRG